MKIILISIGTIGDMEPFISIGEILKENGHQVICIFPEQFRDLAEKSNLGFAALESKYMEILDSDTGRTALGGGGSGFKKFLALLRLAINQTKINKELINKQYDLIESEDPDRIVYNGKAVYPILWGLNNRGKNILISPVPYIHYVRGHSHVAFNNDYGPFLNKLTYSLAGFGLITTVMISKRWLKIEERISRKHIRNALLSNKAIYTISPSLFSRPNVWDDNIKVLGYQAREKTLNWQPDRELSDFLRNHDQILFITFGSMLNPAPAKKTSIIVEVLERNKIPAIINTAAGGLSKPDKYDSGLIYFVSQIPYDWIFPKMYGVIHHGGSGTTHMALKYGCATMVIPHIIDQFVWNKIVSDMGAGPRGIKIAKISIKNLEPKMLELINNSSFKKKAEEVGSQMEKENFRDEIYHSIIE